MIDDTTNSIRPTGARISADGVDARSLGRTVIVLGALDLGDRRGGSTGTATAADISAGAHAHHGANRTRR